MTDLVLPRAQAFGGGRLGEITVRCSGPGSCVARYREPVTPAYPRNLGRCLGRPLSVPNVMASVAHNEG